MNQLEEILFVEQYRYRCFCSEECINGFFTPLIDYFKNSEKKIREEHGIVEEFKMDLFEYEKIVEYTLNNPEELWVHGTQLSEEFFCFISNFAKEEDSFYIIIGTFIFNGVPSFVLFETMTRDNVVLDSYRVGKKIDSLKEFFDTIEKEAPSEVEADHFQNIPIDQETAKFVEGKKSDLMSELLAHRAQDDIPFEEFDKYSIFINDTLENPDEIYRREEDGEEYYNYIRVFEKNNVSFYYIVICLFYKVDVDNNSNLIPVIAFPSTDNSLCRRYRTGDRIEGHSLS